MKQADLEAEYISRHTLHLQSLAQKLISFLENHLQEEPRIDRITARAKSPVRFMEKALKVENGKRKYRDPLNQIQDQIGVRIVTFYLQDVERISTTIDRYFRFIESRLVIPELESQFGYIGKHYILVLPEDVIDETIPRNQIPSFFELQIKTLFQHAWSEANHDLGYKPEEDLTALQKRQLAFTAAQAWGADMVFQEVFQSLSSQLK